MNSNELLAAWGREVLRESGYTVSDDDAVTVELDVEGSGCCDMCYTEGAVISITCGSASIVKSYLD